MERKTDGFYGGLKLYEEIYGTAFMKQFMEINKDVLDDENATWASILREFILYSEKKKANSINENINAIKKAIDDGVEVKNVRFNIPMVGVNGAVRIFEDENGDKKQVLRKGTKYKSKLDEYKDEIRGWMKENKNAKEIYILLNDKKNFYVSIPTVRRFLKALK